MFVYFILIAVVFLLSLLAERDKKARIQIEGQEQRFSNKKYNKALVWLIFISIAFVGAFRYGVGVDFFSYFKTNNWASNFENGNYNEPGFTIFAKACSFISGGANGALTICAAIVTIALFVFTTVKRTDNLIISILLFIFIGVFTGMFNGVRQFLAAAILFAGYPFIFRKKIWKWAIVVVVASSIHITAILMFFVYFICNLKCDWRLVFLYLAIAIFFLFAYEPLFNLVGSLKQEEIDSSLNYMTTNVHILRVLVQCVPVILLVFTNKTKINEDKEARFLLNICLLNAAIAVAAMNSAYFSRFSIYLFTFQILMYPKIFTKMTKENANIFSTLLIIFYSIYWIYSVYSDNSLFVFRWIFPYLSN